MENGAPRGDTLADQEAVARATLTELAHRFDVHVNEMAEWRRPLDAHAAGAYDGALRKPPIAVKGLHVKSGQQTQNTDLKVLLNLCPCARTAFGARHPVWALSQSVAQRIALAGASLEVVRGIRVLVHDADAQRDDVIRRVDEALGLIARVDPRRFLRLRRDLRQILVGRARSTQYWMSTRTCVLQLEEVCSRDPATTAVDIVHESCHARLNNVGIMPTKALRPRLEQRCMREERTFLLRLKETDYGGVERYLNWIEEGLRNLQRTPRP